MTIKREGLLFKIAYGPEWFRSAWETSSFFDPPQQTNVCALFWRTVLMLLIVYPIGCFGGISTGLLYSALFLVVWLANFLVCRWTRANFDMNNSDVLIVKQIKNWPLMFRGHKVYPISIIGVGLVVYGLVFSLIYYWKVWLYGLPICGLMFLIVYFLPNQFTKVKKGEI